MHGPIRPGLDVYSTIKLTSSRTKFNKMLIKRKITKSMFKFSIKYQNKDRDHGKCRQILKVLTELLLKT